MDTVYLVRGKYCGSILGIYSTMDLALRNGNKAIGDTYIDTVALDMPIIDY